MESKYLFFKEKLPIIVIKDNNTEAIIDICLELTPKEYEAFTTHFVPKNISKNQSCYTKLFQDSLKEYHLYSHKTYSKQNKKQEKINALMLELHKCSTFFAELEEMINYPQNIENLTNTLNQFDIKLKNLLKEDSILYKKLNKNITPFLEKIKKIQTNLLNKENEENEENVRNLFSIQTEDSNIPSLGEFIGDQLWLLSDHGIQEIDKINGKLKELFSKDEAAKALSDAKKEIELRSKSLYGIKINNAYTKIPTSMIDSLRIDPNNSNIKNPENPENLEKKRLSIIPYINDLSDIENMIEIINFFETNISRQESTFSIFKSVQYIILQSIVFLIQLSSLMLANLFELAVFSGTRTILTIFIVGTLIALSPISVFFPETYKKIKLYAEKLEDYIGRLHEKFSPIRFLKKLFYKRKYKKLINIYQEKEKKFFEGIEKKHTSLYEELMTDYFSARNTMDIIKKTFAKIGIGVLDIFYSIIFYFNTNKTNEKALEENFILLEKMINESYKDTLGKLQEEIKLILEKKEANTLEQKNVTYWEAAQPWNPNQYQSLIDGIEEIFIATSVFFSDAFRKKPGLANVFMVFSMASFASLTFPAFSAALTKGGLGIINQSLQGVPQWLSEHISGKIIAASSLKLGSNELITQTLAVMLEWKIGFFTSELLIEISQERDLDKITEKILRYSEEITLAVTLLTNLGIELDSLYSQIPEFITLPNLNSFPNPFYILKVIASESRDFFQGNDVPVTVPEFIAFGLKLTLLTEAMMLLNKDEKIEKYNIISIANELISYGIENNLITQDQQKKYRLDSNDFFNKLIENQDKKANLSPQAVKLIQCIKENQKNTEQDIKNRLLKAINMTNDLQKIGENFTQAQAILHFNYLDKLFNEYNHDIEINSLPEELKLDKEKYLDAFYRRYCRTETSPIIEFMVLVIPYPIVPGYRMLKAWLLGLPHLQYEADHYRKKDYAILIQPIAFISRLFRVGLMVFGTHLTRLIIGIFVFPFALTAAIGNQCIGILSGDKKQSFLDPLNWIATQISRIQFHRFKGTAFLAPIYANLVRSAGTLSEPDLTEELSKQALTIVQKIKSYNHTPIISHKNGTNDNHITNALTTHQSIRKKRGNQIRRIAKRSPYQNLVKEKRKKIK